jgi:hypothetical protein
MSLDIVVLAVLVLFAVEGAEIRGVTRSPDDRESPVVTQHDSHGIHLTRPE